MAALKQVHVITSRTRLTKLALIDKTFYDNPDSSYITAINSYNITNILVTSMIVNSGANLSAFNSLDRFETY